MPRLVSLHELDLLGARSDEAHVSLEDVEKLRKLVEARATQQFSDPCDARVVPQLEHRLGQRVEAQQLRKLGFRIPDHRSKFVHPKSRTAHSDSHLQEEDRARAIHQDQEGGREEQGRKRNQCNQGHRHVERTFQEHGRSRNVPGVVLDDRKLTHPCQPRGRAEDALHGRYETELDPVESADRNQPGDELLVRRVRGDDGSPSTARA